jgi:hypothetical protein
MYLFNCRDGPGGVEEFLLVPDEYRDIVDSQVGGQSHSRALQQTQVFRHYTRKRV